MKYFTGIDVSLRFVSICVVDEAGAAAVQIEDQEMPKRCGHLEGKHLISGERMEEPVRKFFLLTIDFYDSVTIIGTHLGRVLTIKGMSGPKSVLTRC